MNESEFNAQWESDKPLYDAWGKFIVSTITDALKEQDKDLDKFLKIPVSPRLKQNQSLIDKAFYRPDKNYSEPYNEIEDKVGARFVVLFLDDIKLLSTIIEDCPSWDFEVCKDFGKDKDTDPLLFTYQSIHYILRPKKEILIEEGLRILTTMPCEIQLRTLLQHAHAELTHDAIYKAKRKVQPKVHRTVAKSMALIETTDDFFTLATKQLNHETFDEYKIRGRLDSLYESFSGMKPYFQKSSIVIWDQFEQFIDEELVEKIQSLLNENQYLSDCIKDHYSESAFYQQSVILFIYWMLKKKRSRLLRDWPFDRSFLLPLANDLGVNTFED